jgi:hypothetical protein
MYAYVDRQLDTLDEGCRFLVWSMRAWVGSLGRSRCPAQMLAPAFAKWRMIGGLQSFHRTMLVLNRDGLETMSFHPLTCPRVSEHEAVMLSLVTEICDGRTPRARDTLDLLVSDSSVGDMLEGLSKLAAAMAIAGLLPGEPAAPPR